MTRYSTNGTRRQVGHGVTTNVASFDFECYSEAGYAFNAETQRWVSCVDSAPHGLGAVGAVVYSEHASTEINRLAYDLKDGYGIRLWVSDAPPPQDLFNHILAGGLLEATNDMFEYWIWKNVCVKKMGWPPLPLNQLRDVAAKARAHGLNGKLDSFTKVLNKSVMKGTEGKRLIRKFCIPHNPTKNEPTRRLYPENDPVDGPKFTLYNIDDVRAQDEASAQMPDLSPDELEVCLADHRINERGVYVDRKSLNNCISVFNSAADRYTTELQFITNGAVMAPSEYQRMSVWLDGRGVRMDNMQAETLEEKLKEPLLPPDCRRVLEIRASLGSASVKKLFAIARMLAGDGRLHDLFVYCGAERTGRFAGRGPQPQNLPKSGPDVYLCECKRYHGAHTKICPWCQRPVTSEKIEWRFEAAQDALEVLATLNLEIVEHYFGDAVSTISGCLRALFIAAPGHDLLCSDYSAIEAVVLAELAGETWRQEVFRTDGKIYEKSASKISGVPFEEFLECKKTTGEHHKLRKLGKVAELASGYAGWIGAWKNFGAEKHFDNDWAMKKAILKWRADSPNIVEFWGGQWRENPNKRYAFTPELYGIEGAVVSAVLSPGQCYSYRAIECGVDNDILYVKLPSGRHLTYHQPRLTPGTDNYSKKPIWKISFMGWNSDYKRGAIGWLRLETYGGRLTENIVQAVARDILAFAIVNLEKNGYPVVLHIHDEPVCEVPQGFGSIEEVERVMMIMPAWAHNWPIRAAGGWRGLRYRKE